MTQSAIETSDDSQKKKKYEEAAKVFASFLEDYADGSYADQPCSTAVKRSSNWVDSDRAAIYYRRLTDMPAMAKSALRPDALFSLAVVYEEQKQAKLATEAYEAS